MESELRPLLAMRAMGAALAEEVGDDPEDGTGRLLVEHGKTFAWAALTAAQSDGQDMDAEQVGSLTRTVHDIIAADKTVADRQAVVERLTAARAKRLATDAVHAHADGPAEVLSAIVASIEGEAA